VIYYISALWGAVIAGAVLGRMIDPPEPPEPEVFDSNPAIMREQMKTWSKEFFGPPALIIPSRTEILDEFAPFLHDSPSARSYSSSSQSRRYFNQQSSDRLNGKHFDVSGIHMESPKIKAENLEWMLKNIFMYPRNHNTNETAKDFAKKYIVDSLQLTSGLYTSVQHFQPIQFLNIVSDH